MIDLSGLLGVRLRVGVEALAALLAESALGDEAAQDRRRGEALAVALGRVLQALEDLVEAFDVGLHERRQQAAARIEAGAGHHPEVDVAVGGDALLEHQAGLDERLQREQLDQLGHIGLPVAVDVRLAVGVEAVPAGLRAELALADQALHALRHVEALVAVGLREVLGDVQDGVETEQIDQVVGADRDDARGADARVDLLDRELLLLLLAPDLGDARVEDPVDDEARNLGAGDRLLANRLGEGDGGGDGLRRGLLALDDLDQRHDRGRVEVVEADDLLRPQRRFADLGDRQRRGVRRQDRVAGRGGVELGEHGLLDLDLLRHGLDHEIDVAEVRVGGRAVDAPEHLLDLRLALLCGELALLDELAHLALR